MIFNQNNRLAIQGTILTSLLTLLASCSNSAALEGIVSADPKLKENKIEQSKPANSQPAQNSSPPASKDSQGATPQLETAEDEVDNAPLENPTANNKLSQDNPEFADLLLDFPNSFPVYPQAELQEVKSDEENNSGILIWNTSDNRQAVADYYQAELLANGWSIIKPFTVNPQQKIARAIAIKDQLRIELTILKAATKQKPKSKNTQLSLAYRPVSQDAPSSISQAIESAEPNRSELAETESPRQKPDSDNSEQFPIVKKEFQPGLSNTESVSTPEEDNNYFDSSNQNFADSDFADLDEVPEQLQQPLKSVATLGILTPYTGKANTELSKFAPNETITRGEYARWLIEANNLYYSDNPGKKIYIAAKTNQPAFKDVNVNHPDFAAIESLAEAGLIPSRLTEDSDNLLFRPDAPLIREDLVTWKVPLDTRQSLPKASIEAIEESWGFQDAANINSAAVRALYADYQNGDRSNVRRIFGYTTLFQPKKPVTRAEAAASLWYFGFQGEGITAREVLEAEAELKTDKE